MKKLFLTLALLLAGQANAQSSGGSYEFHKQLDRCYRDNQILCVAHVLVDAIFAVKDDGGHGPDHGQAFTVEFFESYAGTQCASYSIVKFSLVHSNSEENLRRCEKLTQQYGQSRVTYCQKLGGQAQVIRGAYVGNACKDLAYQ